MSSANRQLSAVAAPARLLNLPETAGICRPRAMNRRLRALLRLVEQQSAWLQAGREKKDEDMVAMLGQALVFSCYQTISMLVAWECWRLFREECVAEGHIIVDNLTGALNPLPGRQDYARAICQAVFTNDKARQLAWRIYQFTSAFLHSYPHLVSASATLSTPYRGADGVWHSLGPWRVDDMLDEVAELLYFWQ